VEGGERESLGGRGIDSGARKRDFNAIAAGRKKKGGKGKKKKWSTKMAVEETQYCCAQTLTEIS